MARSYKRLAMSKRVMVNLLSGSAIDGILWDDRGSLIVLRDGNLHSEGGSAPLDGDILIEREQINFVQVVS